MVTALNVISCQLISSGTGTFPGWLQRQHTEEWQRSECWVTGREQQPLTTSLVAPAVADRMEARSGETAEVSKGPLIQKGFIQKALHRRWKEQRELLSSS